MKRKYQKVNFCFWVFIFTLSVLSALPFSTSVYGEELVYSDRDLMVATQIAYYDFTKEQLEAKGGQASVRELLQDKKVYHQLQNKVNLAENDFKKQMAKKDLELYEEIVRENSKYGSWKVVDVKNTNQETGFYGVLLETDKEHAIVGFRGSESTDYNQVLKDWINADVGLLMAKDTLQQKNAAAYMREINEKYDYEYYGVTGHSLGGNLAEHAVIAAPDEMREKLRQVISFDGPGYSGEYIIRNKELMEMVSCPIIHYRWSLIGALLTQPTCTQSRIILVTDDIRESREKEALYMRHATPFIQWSGESVQDGKADLLSIAMRKWSVDVDEMVMKKRREKDALP